MQKALKMSLKGKSSGNGRNDTIFMILKTTLDQGVFCSCPGTIYLKMTIIVKQSYWYISQMTGERLLDQWSSGVSNSKAS